MASKVIPLTPGKNQSITCTLPVDGANLTLALTLTWNGMGNYWFMSITNPATQTLILDGVPLLPGDYPAGNILGQYAYLGIGSAFLVPASTAAAQNNPTSDNLGSDYLLVWSDTMG